MGWQSDKKRGPSGLFANVQFRCNASCTPVLPVKHREWRLKKLSGFWRSCGIGVLLFANDFRSRFQVDCFRRSKGVQARFDDSVRLIG
jgi:hypothetical protein